MTDETPEPPEPSDPPDWECPECGSGSCPPGGCSKKVTTIHVSLSIRGALKWPKRQLKGLFRTESGGRTTAEQSRERLLDLLSEGKEVLPMGPCEGFDFKEGCPGHREEP